VIEAILHPFQSTAPVTVVTEPAKPASPTPEELEAKRAEGQRQWEEQQRQHVEGERQVKLYAAKFKAAVDACTPVVQRQYFVDNFDAYVDQNGDIRAFGTGRTFFAFNKCMDARGYSTNLKLDKK
jgi:hypothetical protein